MRQAKVRDYYGAVILYNFFENFNFIKWKNSKLESCRSRRGLQFSYKNHLHPMLYRRVMIFQRFSRNKLEKKKQNRGNCSKSGFTVANRGRTVPCKPCKTGLDLGWTGSQVRGARCPVSKFMDLFDTALQVQVPTVHFTLNYKLINGYVLPRWMLADISKFAIGHLLSRICDHIIFYEQTSTS